jgi:hypothetical protein
MEKLLFTCLVVLVIILAFLVGFGEGVESMR